MEEQKLTLLVQKAQKNDPGAMDELLRQIYQTLYYYAFNSVKDKDLALDITQESCVEIIQTIRKLRNPEAFRSWAGRIVAHQCTRYYRQNREDVLPVYEEEEEGSVWDQLPDESRGSLPEQVVEDKEFQKIIWQMLDHLSPAHRQALLLYYHEHYSVDQVAQILGEKPGTIKSRLHYGRKMVIRQTEAYEKKHGIKLHSIAPLPLLYYLFRQNMLEVAASEAAVSQAVAVAVGAAGSGSAAAGGTAVGKLLSGLTGKIMAAAAAVAVAAGAVAGGIALSGGKSAGKDFAGEWTRIPMDPEEVRVLEDAEPLVIGKNGTLEYEGVCYQLREVDYLEDGEETRELAASLESAEIPEGTELTAEDSFYLRYDFAEEGGLLYLGNICPNDVGEIFSNVQAVFYRESDYENYTKVILTEENISQYILVDCVNNGVYDLNAPYESYAGGAEQVGVWTSLLFRFDWNLGAASYCIMDPTLELLLETRILEQDHAGFYGMSLTEFGETRWIEYPCEQLAACGRYLTLSWDRLDTLTYDAVFDWEDLASGRVSPETAQEGRLLSATDVYGVVFVPNS